MHYIKRDLKRSNHQFQHKLNLISKYSGLYKTQIQFLGIFFFYTKIWIVYSLRSCTCSVRTIVEIICHTATRLLIPSVPCKPCLTAAKLALLVYPSAYMQMNLFAVDKPAESSPVNKMASKSKNTFVFWTIP
jgi:hypothetical protein